MELSELQQLLSDQDFVKLKTAVEMEKVTFVNMNGYVADKGASDVYTLGKLTKFRKQYYPQHHDVMDQVKRPDKQVQDGDKTTPVAVTRLPVSLQKLIVSRAAAFLCGNPIERVANAESQQEKDLLSVVEKTWDDNKLDYESKRLAKLMMSETECAELWYVEKADPSYWKNTVNANTTFSDDQGKTVNGPSPYRLRMKLLAHSLGDLLFPVFNSSNDLIAFGRSYMMYSGGKMIEHFDIYTDTVIYYSNALSGRLQYEKEEPNLIGKIPVIYYYQPFPEWHDVQHLIDRFEKSISNHGDTNDYFGSPMVVVEGEVTGFAKKGDQGKVLEIKNGGKASYLTWDQSPESVKLEQQNLRSLIHDMTDTPDISIEQMKAIGTFSGVALTLLFLPAHLKAADKEETFGKSIQRRLNFIKAAMAKINVQLEPGLSMTIKPKFEYYLPKDTQSLVNQLTEAVTGGIMSRETAIERNPLIEDAEQEKTRMEQEAGAPTALDDVMNGGGAGGA
jgi:SPP1 family phage portal protein